MVRTAERLSARAVQTATAAPSKSKMLADGKGLYLRIGPTGSTDAAAQALDLLGRAIERDPHYGLALAAAAFCHSQRFGSGWTGDPESERRQGIELARRALQAGSDDSNAIVFAVGALANSGEDVGLLMRLIDNLLALNPSSAHGWNWSGWLRLFAGNADLAIDRPGCPYVKSSRLLPETTMPRQMIQKSCR